MDTKPDIIQSIHHSIAADGPVCRIETGHLCIVDPEKARYVENENFREVFVPGTSMANPQDGVLWRDVRQALIRRSSEQVELATLQNMRRRLSKSLATCGDSSVDLTVHLAKSVSGALVPCIIADASTSDHRAIIRDQEEKLSGFLTATGKLGRLARLRGDWYEFLAGRAVKRTLAKRRRRMAPDIRDSAGAILDMDPRLSPTQASYVVMTVLTAASGAPGALAACLAFELLRQQAHAESMRMELAGLSEEAFLSNPVRSAPFCYNMVREVLRLWSFPIVTTRQSLKDIVLGHHRLNAGDFYHLSSYFTHHNQQYWDDAETLMPDRWSKGRGCHDAFVPFGWSARSCPGASLGLAQLMIVAMLLVTEFDIVLDSAANPQMRLVGTPLPTDFVGMIRRRGN